MGRVFEATVSALKTHGSFGCDAETKAAKESPETLTYALLLLASHENKMGRTDEALRTVVRTTRHEGTTRK